MRLLLELAAACGLEARRDAMYRGEHVNPTEDRPALHVALRLPRDRSLVVDGVDVVREVHDVLDRMAALADAIRSGAWRGHTGERIRDVVNIGIGGCDLGPAMACQALARLPRTRSSMSASSRTSTATDLVESLARPRARDDARDRAVEDVHDPGDDGERRDRRQWLVRRARRRRVGDRQALRRGDHQRRGGRRVRHRPANAFGFWDWVGGRYSCRLGDRAPIADRGRAERFRELLAGFHASTGTSRRRRSSATCRCCWAARRLVPQLPRLPTAASRPTTQDLRASRPTCSSSRWSATASASTSTATPVAVATSPVVWGEPGTNGQHAFFQMLHQGTTSSRSTSSRSR